MTNDQSPITVLKFGGTSVKDAEAMRRVVTIVERERDNRPVVITSACAGVTDALLECARLCGDSNAAAALERVAELRVRHLDILDDLTGDSNDITTDTFILLKTLLDELEQLVHGVILLGELTPRTMDAFAGFGERLSSVLLVHAFHIAGWRAALADSRRCIITDGHFTRARPLLDNIDECTKAEILPLLLSSDVVVMQGFIGSTVDGIQTTIGRGGSDHTGALIGAALGAHEIQIWTDVSGILTADPRVVPTAHVVPEVTFTEARELAHFGAKVIHPDTILPAVARGIPVVIKNSMQPNDAGTRILPDGTPIERGIHSITLKRGMTMIALAPREHIENNWTPEHSLGLFAEHSTRLECAVVAESRVLAVVLSTAYNDILHTALESSCLVELTHQYALLCLTGAGLRTEPAVLSAPLAALEGIPIAFVAAGSSEHTVLIGVAEERATEALAAVHRKLFED